MFIGHNAVGLASKRAAQRTSPGTLMTAASVLDFAIDCWWFDRHRELRA